MGMAGLGVSLDQLSPSAHAEDFPVLYGQGAVDDGGAVIGSTTVAE
ncbi:MAG: hypothetical protein WKF47_04830 [Geodermatophilaceae bacterium]